MKIIELGITVLSTSIICTGIFLYLRSDTTRYTRQNTSLSTMPISESWQVISVHDGDTIKVKKDGTVQNIRLCGIDAPKISQPLGKDSRDYLLSLLPVGKDVQISIVDTDKYNRKIGEIFLTGTNPEKFINEEMTVKGMAYNYDRYPLNISGKELFRHP
jgi:endonuclease YncB( thermonuclease family)